MITLERTLIVGIALGSLTAFGQALAPPAPPTPPLPPQRTVIAGPSVRTNRTKLFAQTPQANPVLPPEFAQPAQPRPAVVQSPVRPYQPGAPVGATPQSPYYNPALAAAPVVPKPPTQPPSYIAWDAESKEYNAKPGDSMASFTFYLTNVSAEVVMINSVHTSCGCTVAKLPEQPWHLQPGTNGPINVTVNLAGKSGTIVKSVTIDTSTGVKSLLVKVNIPTAQPVASGVDVDRMRNMQMALADRQAVFKGECAKCHSEPAHAKNGAAVVGAPLYAAVCGNCHDSPQRAALVPDLKNLKHPTNDEHWKKWIASGRVGSMMPAFAKAEGGPLDDSQIESLVHYLSSTIPSIPAGGPKPLVGAAGTATAPKLH
jgi:mono/diheme cytochrome c family protein